ncbi:Carboxypeptidase Y-like protein A [Frankliniella fusca]|uniref:Carboxypeptidase Y-like protein A n=1 Tax=Frankliniella fusca TaxID=407009 RepID=A0AAE1GXF1_9NEOP|nr:Carboxypeptidase Y-like protein A [Frankliniella fusca]
MSAQEEVRLKSLKRDEKTVLLETRKAFEVAIHAIDAVLLKDYSEVDLDETFFEPAELAAAALQDGLPVDLNIKNPSACTAVERKVDVSKFLSKPTPKPKPQRKVSKKFKPSGSSSPVKVPDGHVCSGPRCKYHQPFRATAREVKLMSEEERKLWRSYAEYPSYTPEGYWDLEFKDRK